MPNFACLGSQLDCPWSQPCNLRKIAFEHCYVDRFSPIESALLVLLNFSSTSPLDLDDNDAPCKAQLSLSGKLINVLRGYLLEDG